MITPLEEIDVFYVLPYLSCKDIHHILIVKKNIPHEYKLHLMKYKMNTFCDLSYCHQYNLQPIQYIIHVSHENQNELEYLKNKEKIQIVILKQDLNNVSYLHITYKDSPHIRVIYYRKICVKNEINLLYTQ